MRFMEDQRLKGAVDDQFQAFLVQESKKQQFQRLALNLTDICWQLCIGSPDSSLSSSSRNCIVNCVERFIDTSNFIAYRLENIVFQNPTELDVQ
ncbi:PREDICTED: mitochondrial import inner membrane translocase subunit Tim8 A-like isoform X2 [Eufriesea mexicana]|uniref:mitochondrial import inner membrane translocase subunit Tim8 A-like isoform X2 n=1 Tax=Eufriesea mexicana TaxID=516756 RepID=UPI00083BCC75|nr:PREDICTED: mitochondrial import inner membrane translocase subunit Tim8 A-like isoform X2 [Eufriesea mexicana]